MKQTKKCPHIHRTELPPATTTKKIKSKRPTTKTSRRRRRCATKNSTSFEHTQRHTAARTHIATQTRMPETVWKRTQYIALNRFSATHPPPPRVPCRHPASTSRQSTWALDRCWVFCRCRRCRRRRHRHFCCCSKWTVVVQIGGLFVLYKVTTKLKYEICT